MIQLNQDQKLSPLYVLYVVIKVAILFLIPYMFFSLFHWQGFIVFLFIVIGIPVMIREWLYVNTFNFQLNDNGVIINSGIIFKKTKTIPYSSTQTINIGRGLLRKWMGIATVNIWTASPNQLNVKTMNTPDGWVILSIEDAEWMSNFILSKKSK